MARNTGPKNRIARREGENLGLKSGINQKLERRLKVLPGQHGRMGKKKTSEYGVQLREKQKVKAIYGVLETQFRKYFKIASKTHGATGETLLSLLERRLDNVVYRLNFASTRASARQLVNHGHVSVNGKKNTIPSYLIKVNEVISLDATALSMPDVKKQLSDTTPMITKWLEKKAAVGRVTRMPMRDDIEMSINDQLIVEFYSR